MGLYEISKFLKTEHQVIFFFKKMHSVLLQLGKARNVVRVVQEGKKGGSHRRVIVFHIENGCGNQFWKLRHSNGRLVDGESMASGDIFSSAPVAAASFFVMVSEAFLFVTVINVTGPVARDMDSLVLCMKALLCDELFRLDPAVPPLPFNDEVRKLGSERDWAAGRRSWSWFLRVPLFCQICLTTYRCDVKALLPILLVISLYGWITQSSDSVELLLFN